jgi:hypothetical protein
MNGLAPKLALMNSPGFFMPTHGKSLSPLISLNAVADKIRVKLGRRSIPTDIIAVLREEGRAGSKVHPAPDDVSRSEFWTVRPSMLTGIENLSVVAVVRPRFGFPARKPRQDNLLRAESEAYESPRDHQR